MRYELMFPEQIRKSIDENWPAVLPLGVLEYHAEHCCVGVDTLLVIRAVEELEKEMDMVILPPFYYGAASFAVDSPERKGTIHVKSEVASGSNFSFGVLVVASGSNFSFGVLVNCRISNIRYIRSRVLG